MVVMPQPPSYTVLGIVLGCDPGVRLEFPDGPDGVFRVEMTADGWAAFAAGVSLVLSQQARIARVERASAFAAGGTAH